MHDRELSFHLTAVTGSHPASPLPHSPNLGVPINRCCRRRPRHITSRGRVQDQ
jgi:hypothetical protein